jgi:glycosyltransferase involved in cell wall biosynthesis
VFFSVVIDNYNYRDYIGAAVESVLAQSCRDFELIVVDDGSTDGSREVVDRCRDPRLKRIYKPNGGQLSCFNAAAEAVAGEVVCFLDADDLYEPEYLERLKRFYAEHPDCGCAFCRLLRFGDAEGVSVDCDEVVRWGRSAFLTATLHLPVGAETSGCSMRADVFRRFLPWRDGESEWKIRADDVLLWSAALCGAVKYFIPETLVRYRVHDRNGFYGRKSPDPAALARRKRAAVACCERLIPADFDWGGAIRDELRDSALPRRYYWRALAIRVRNALKRGKFPGRGEFRILFALLAGIGKSRAISTALARKFGL